MRTSVGVSLRPPCREIHVNNCFFQEPDGLGRRRETHLEGLGQRGADGGGNDDIIGILGGAARRKNVSLIGTAAS